MARIACTADKPSAVHEPLRLNFFFIFPSYLSYLISHPHPQLFLEKEGGLNSLIGNDILLKIAQGLLSSLTTHSLSGTEYSVA